MVGQPPAHERAGRNDLEPLGARVVERGLRHRVGDPAPATDLRDFRVLQIDRSPVRTRVGQLRVATIEVHDEPVSCRLMLDGHHPPQWPTTERRKRMLTSRNESCTSMISPLSRHAMTHPTGALPPSNADASPIERDVPDHRRDAIEEAAETSPEATSRIDQLNAKERAVDPALAHPRHDSAHSTSLNTSPSPRTT